MVTRARGTAVQARRSAAAGTIQQAPGYCAELVEDSPARWQPSRREPSNILLWLASRGAENTCRATVEARTIKYCGWPSEGIPSYLAASSGCRCALANQMASLGPGGLGFRLYPALV